MTIAPESFGFVRDLVHRESAIVLGQGKEYLVESRLLPLARQAGAVDVDSFIAGMRTRPDPVSRKNVVEALTTNETSWFRDGEPFTALTRTVLPELAGARASTRRLRVWAAACSTGQEPYSIAMSVLDQQLMAGWSTEILATDLSEEVLARGRSGRYSQLEVNRGLPVTHLVRHFTRQGPDWQITPELARMVEFRPLNLVRPFPAIGTFDVVFLRNVLIYFDAATKREVLGRVRKVLAPDGYLFLGAAETTMGVDDAWERVPAGRASMYRLRKDVP